MIYLIIDCIATGTIIGVLAHIIYGEKWMAIMPSVILANMGAIVFGMSLDVVGVDFRILMQIIGTASFLMLISYLRTKDYVNDPHILYDKIMLRAKKKRIVK